MKITFKLLCMLSYFFMISIVYSQDCEKGFKEIKKQKLDKAFEVFNKIIVKKPDDAGSYFGLAILFINSDFPNFNPDQAYINIIKAQSFFDKMQDQKEINKLNKININKASIDSIRIAIESKILVLTSQNKSIQAFDDFLSKYPNAHNVKECINLKYIFAYESAKQINTLESYNNFISIYADAPQKDTVIILRNEKAFEESKILNTIAAYDNYIKKYPNSINYKDAITLRNKLAFDEAKTKNTLEAYDDFIIKYPNADEINTVKEYSSKLAFQKAKDINTVESYQDYLNKYPNSIHFNDFVLLRDSLAFEIAKQANTKKAYKDFIKKYPNAKQVILANINISNIKTDSYVLAQYIYKSQEYQLDEEYYFQCYPYLSPLVYFYNLDIQMDICLNVPEHGRYQTICGDMFIINSETNEIVTKLKYKPELIFNEGFYIVHIRNDEKTFLSLDGKLFKGRWEDILPFSEGLAAIKLNGLWGYIDKNESIVIKPQYVNASSFKNGLAPVNIPGKGWGYINKLGNYKIEPKYVFASEFNYGIAEVKSFNSDKVIIDTNDNIIINKKYSPTNKSDKNLIISENDYISGTDKKCIVNNDRFIIKKSKKFGLIDENGNLLGNTLYDYIGLFVNGIAPARLNSLWGYIDTDGKVIRDFIYSNAKICRLKKSFATLKENNKIVIIDFTKSSDKDIITKYTYTKSVSLNSNEIRSMDYDYNTNKFSIILKGENYDAYYLNEKGVCIEGCK